MRTRAKIAAIVSSTLVATLIIILSYSNMYQKSESGLYFNNPYENIEQVNGVTKIGEKSYFFTTLNDTTIGTLTNNTKIQFHNVTFIFPSGSQIGPGGVTIQSTVYFPDSISEYFNVGMSSSPSSSGNTVTELSAHTEPQAGLTLHNGLVKLLVSMN